MNNGYFLHNNSGDALIMILEPITILAWWWDHHDQPVLIRTLAVDYLLHDSVPYCAILVTLWSLFSLTLCHVEQHDISFTCVKKKKKRLLNLVILENKQNLKSCVFVKKKNANLFTTQNVILWFFRFRILEQWKLKVKLGTANSTHDTQRFYCTLFILRSCNRFASIKMLH